MKKVIWWPIFTITSKNGYLKPFLHRSVWQTQSSYRQGLTVKLKLWPYYFEAFKKINATVAGNAILWPIYTKYLGRVFILSGIFLQKLPHYRIWQTIAKSTRPNQLTLEKFKKNSQKICHLRNFGKASKMGSFKTPPKVGKLYVKIKLFSSAYW